MVLLVSESAIQVRPWNPPSKLMIALRPVYARAIFIEFSTASDPELKNAAFPAPLISPTSRSATFV
jgi:hypothetical protein